MQHLQELKFFQDTQNLLLIAVAFVSGAMLLWPYLKRSSGGPWASTLQATMMMNQEDGQIVDVRDEADFAKGHVLNARNIPLAQFEKRIGELSSHKDKPLIVYCHSGNTSGAAIEVLKKNGFTRPFNLHGGVAAWQQAGLPLQK
ncbi:MAG: rhodanese-like domain-containing protein [Betaproteobacteria bacterium]|nr:rhodanese-like domain-containing protein [Pseudomonadota bacterium]